MIHPHLGVLLAEHAEKKTTLKKKEKKLKIVVDDVDSGKLVFFFAGLMKIYHFVLVVSL